MNSIVNENKSIAVPADIQAMHDILAEQRISYSRHPHPTAEERIERLARLRRVIIKYQDEFTSAISQDYGNRSEGETKIGEIMTTLEHITYYSKNLERWMRPSKRHISPLHMPAKGWVEYQPLGVVVIISPWNYPLLLAMSPLVCALAGGNHAMIKISSSSARLGQVLEKALAEAFPRDLVAVINGGGPISDAFSHLAFDKLIFTGSTEVGKTVMRAASENLVPVILELGGKSPAIVHESTSIKDVAQRIAVGKLWNAGQTCVAPDYLYVPRGKTGEFVEEFKKCVKSMYPSLKKNQDYTSIIGDKQYRRLQGYLQNAKEQGAQIIEINPKSEDLTDVRKIAPTLLTDVHATMDIMKNEIFGPLLPIFEYDYIDDVLSFVNARPRPLALYYFDYDKDRADYIAKNTHSGHFGINQVITHVAQDDMPFGGIGASGMGKYHGEEGFYSFSHGRSVMSKPKFYALKFVAPPFNRPIHKIIYKTLLRK